MAEASKLVIYSPASITSDLVNVAIGKYNCKSEQLTAENYRNEHTSPDDTPGFSAAVHFIQVFRPLIRVLCHD